MKHIIYKGFKFTKDDKTGYYLNSNIRKRLHRYIWEKEKGIIPNGYHIHHIDGNKNNNDINNLDCISAKEHLKKHGYDNFNNDKDWFENFHSKGIEEAKKWHKSEEGIKWHKQHYINTKDKLHVEEEYICIYCNKIFKAIKTGKNKFCSNKCKSAHRRNKGIDNEKRICLECGGEFIVNKYSKKLCCNRSCSNRRMWRKRCL